MLRLRRWVEPALVVLTVAALAAGGIAWLAGWRAVADHCWIAGTVVALVPALVWMLADVRGGRVGVDLIAVFSSPRIWDTGPLSPFWARCRWVR